MVVRKELVVCCATLRLSDCAPDSEKVSTSHLSTSSSPC
jgi:hypothetical protein